MNKAILVGYLARDPEIRYTNSGKAVATFTIAVNRNFGSSAEQREADFIPVVAWERLAETIGNNLTKGRRVLVEGRMQVRTYEAESQQRRYITEVIAQNIEFLDYKKDQATPENYDPEAFNCLGKDVKEDDKAGTDNEHADNQSRGQAPGPAPKTAKRAAKKSNPTRGKRTPKTS